MDSRPLILTVRREGEKVDRTLFVYQYRHNPNGRKAKAVPISKARKEYGRRIEDEKRSSSSSSSRSNNHSPPPTSGPKRKRKRSLSPETSSHKPSPRRTRSGVVLNTSIDRNKEASSSSSSSSSSSEKEMDDSHGSSDVGPSVLFVTNLDLDMSKEDVEEMMARETGGKVTGIAEAKLEDEEGIMGPVRAMHVVFEDRSSLVAALRATRMTMQARDTGFEAWVRTRKRARLLQRGRMVKYLEDVEAVIAAYDEAKAKAREETQARIKAEADEGWTLVTSANGRKNNKVRSKDGTTVKAAGSAGSAQGRLRKSRKRKKRDKGPVLDFYRIHRNTEKRNELNELRLRFEEDKAKMEQLKARNAFSLRNA